MTPEELDELCAELSDIDTAEAVEAAPLGARVEITTDD